MSTETGAPVQSTQDHPTSPTLTRIVRSPCAKMRPPTTPLSDPSNFGPMMRISLTSSGGSLLRDAPDRETVRRFTRRAARDHAETRRLLGDGLRLAEGRSAAEYLPEVHHRDRRLDIHFIHVRSKHTNALPIIITHGWPGSIVEQLKIIEPLTNPTAYRRQRSRRVRRRHSVDARLGFSASRPKRAEPPRIAQAWVTLMKRLGYFVSGPWRRRGALMTRYSASWRRPKWSPSTPTCRPPCHRKFPGIA